MRLVDLLKKKGAKKTPSEEEAEEEKAPEDEPREEAEEEDVSPGDISEPAPSESELSFSLFSEDDDSPSDDLPLDDELTPEALLEELGEEEPPPASPLTDAYLAKDLTEDLSKEPTEELTEEEAFLDAHITKVLGAKEIYVKTMAACRSIMEDVRADRPLNVEPLEDIAANLFAHGDPDKTIFLLAMEEPADHFLVSHCLNVALYSLKLGIGFGYSMDELKELTMAGLLHDVGLLKIPEEIIEKDAELTGMESEEIRKHTQFGYDIVAELGPRFEKIAKVVLTHHERVDGSGYPSGLKGDEIPEMSQIVGIAETYDTLINDRPYRRSIPPFDAVKIILEEERGKYSPKMLKLFLTEISIFPINSLVRLSNQAVARVVALNRNLPLRPVVEIIINPQGQRLDHKELLDLSRNPLLYIASSVSAEEVGINRKTQP